MVTAVQTFSQSITDVASDNTFTSRWIGPSTLDKTRLTVHSALTRANDKQDVYRFLNTQDTDSLTFSQTTHGSLKVELLDTKGRVVADSTAKKGTLAADNYDKLVHGTLSAKKGMYYVRVSRGPDAASKNEAIEYYFQITNGKKNSVDYDTEEAPPPGTPNTVAAATQGTQNIAASLADSMPSLLDDTNFFSQLRSIYGSVVNISV